MVVFCLVNQYSIDLFSIYFCDEVIMKILNSVLIACAWWVAQVSAVVVGIHIYYEYF